MVITACPVPEVQTEAFEAGSLRPPVPVWRAAPAAVVGAAGHQRNPLRQLLVTGLDGRVGSETIESPCIWSPENESI